jgi:ubiquitin-protein ligase
MILTIEDIRNYMKQKNIDNTLDINKPIKSLGIYQIKEEKNPNDNGRTWFVKIKGPELSLYKKGVFTIRIDFPPNYPEERPRAFFVTKICHIQVDPSNFNTCILFLNEWKKITL